MIYLNDPTKREIRRKTGRTGYFDEDWHGLSGDVVDTITGKMENYSELLKNKTETWANMSKGQLNERVAGFQDFGLKNMREGYIDKRMNEAALMREQASDVDLAPAATRVTNLSQAQANRNRRVQGFLGAKRKLKAAEDMSGPTGSAYKYNMTEYDRLNPEIDTYYAEFDRMIDERKQAYANAYGVSSFDDFDEGFGMFGLTETPGMVGTGRYTDRNGNVVEGDQYANRPHYDEIMEEGVVTTPDYNSVGQQDVMNMIFSDITGMSYDEVTFASTAELGYTSTMSQEYMSTLDNLDMSQVTNLGEGGIESMRSVYANFFYNAAEGADKAADQEDAFRIASAAKAKRDDALNQKRMASVAEESTAEAITDINQGIRQAEQEYEQTKTQLLGGGIPSQRKAKAVTFKDARPQ